MVNYERGCLEVLSEGADGSYVCLVSAKEAPTMTIRRKLESGISSSANKQAHTSC